MVGAANRCCHRAENSLNLGWVSSGMMTFYNMLDKKGLLAFVELTAIDKLCPTQINRRKRVLV
jgi:hypothetical protein